MNKRPGFYRNVPPEEYHSWAGLSKSRMSKLAITPAHLRDAIQNPDSELQTAAQAIGSAVHCIILEPGEFAKRYAERPEGMKGTTKEGKDFKAQAEAGGQAVLSFEDSRWCRAIAQRVYDHPLIGEWLCRHEKIIEPSLVWDRDGFACKARPDCLFPEFGVVIDPKTTTFGGPAFGREIRKYGYALQGAWYLDGLRRLGMSYSRFILVAMEKRRPFLVSLHEIRTDSDVFGAATAECDRLFGIYRQCMTTGVWPGYQNEPYPVSVDDMSSASVDVDEHEESLESLGV